MTRPSPLSCVSIPAPPTYHIPILPLLVNPGCGLYSYSMSPADLNHDDLKSLGEMAALFILLINTINLKRLKTTATDTKNTALDTKDTAQATKTIIDDESSKVINDDSKVRHLSSHVADLKEEVRELSNHVNHIDDCLDDHAASTQKRLVRMEQQLARVLRHLRSQSAQQQQRGRDGTGR